MYPDDRRYTKEHEWVKVEGDRARVGITDYAQNQLGDVVYLELPEVGRVFKAGETFGTMESVKAVSELYAPLAGEVVEVHAELVSQPRGHQHRPARQGLDDRDAAVAIPPPPAPSWTPPATSRCSRAAPGRPGDEHEPDAAVPAAPAPCGVLREPADPFRRGTSGPQRRRRRGDVARGRLRLARRADRRRGARRHPAAAAAGAARPPAASTTLSRAAGAGRRGTRSSAPTSAWATTAASRRR